MLRHILIPLDGSQLAEKSLEYARRISNNSTAITLLMAVDPQEHIAYGMYQPGVSQASATNPVIDYKSITDDLLEQGHRYLNRVADDLRKSGYKVDVILELGAPADIIIETAGHAEIDTIVMSTHGRSGLTRWLLGSITQKIISAAPCPVYVIPPARNGK
ncbi:MAG: universal stress protein [Anaerolineae bacterium]|nr:universal stress protein [Anaerolineae bacterium]